MNRTLSAWKQYTGGEIERLVCNAEVRVLVGA